MAERLTSDREEGGGRREAGGGRRHLAKRAPEGGADALSAHCSQQSHSRGQFPFTSSTFPPLGGATAWAGDPCPRPTYVEQLPC